MTVTLVLAVSENGVIGREGRLPWRLSSDLKRFKADTIGRPIIMGRKTWESIGRPLPGRTNIVVTRNPDWQAPGAESCISLAQAIALARKRPGGSGEEGEICIIGGAEIFREAVRFADRMKVTHVLGRVEGDVYLPEIDPRIWRVVHSQEFPAGEKDSHATRYVIYEAMERRETGNSSVSR